MKIIDGHVKKNVFFPVGAVGGGITVSLWTG